MGAPEYEKQKYLAGAECARRCMAQLREHYDNVTIAVSYSDASGNGVSLELEWTEDDDDDEDDDKGHRRRQHAVHHHQ
jgi:hypothetical protein